MVARKEQQRGWIGGRLRGLLNHPEANGEGFERTQAAARLGFVVNQML
jgi:hypothetical protein